MKRKLVTVSFYLDEDPHTYLPKMGYWPLFKDKWIKPLGNKAYPRYHVYSYEYEFLHGYRCVIHIDTEPHKSTHRDTAPEVDRLTANNFNIDAIVEQRKKILNNGLPKKTKLEKTLAKIEKRRLRDERIRMGFKDIALEFSKIKELTQNLNKNI